MNYRRQNTQYTNNYQRRPPNTENSYQRISFANKQQPEPEIEHVKLNGIMPYILNKSNVLLTKKFVENTLLKYGIKYKIKNLALFQRAMVHTSYIQRDFIRDKTKTLSLINKNFESLEAETSSKTLPLFTQSYEILEFNGDAVIHDALTNYLVDRYSNTLNNKEDESEEDSDESEKSEKSNNVDEDEDEGFLTKLRTKLEKRESLAELSNKIGFDKYIIIGKYIEDLYGRGSNTQVMEDVMEAFVGALRIDSKDIPMCHRFVINLMEAEVDIPALIRTEDNFKDLLLQHYHSMKWNDPVYDPIHRAQSTDPNKKEKRIFEIVVKGVMGDIIGRGTGTTKIVAEQNAAKMALETLDALPDNLSDESEERTYEIK